VQKLVSDNQVVDEALIGVSVDPDELRKPGRWWAPIVMAVVLAASMIVALAIGPSWLPVSQVWDVLAHHLGENNHPTPTANAIVWDLRLPRTVLAALCGAGLAVTGAVMQAVLVIPIADPYILGTSSGASLGAVIVLVVLNNSGAGALSIGAFAGALGAFLVVMIIGWGSRSSPARVLLAGVAVGYMADAVFSLILTENANAQQTQDLTFWTLGSFGGATWNQIILVLVVVILVSCFCMARARGMDALVFGDELAAAVGVDANRLRCQLSVVVALLTAVMVAVCGEIGFIGLVIPNVGRWIVGIGHRRLLPVVALGGAVFAVWADTIARTVFAPTEVPVGVITALVGAPFFIVLLVSRKEQI
jgi:iron complex transport system permease protein